MQLCIQCGSLCFALWCFLVAREDCCARLLQSVGKRCNSNNGPLQFAVFVPLLEFLLACFPCLTLLLALFFCLFRPSSLLSHSPFSTWHISLHLCRSSLSLSLNLSLSVLLLPLSRVFSPSLAATIAALLQEIVSMYPLLQSPTLLTPAASNRCCNALALLQVVASHSETRSLFLNGRRCAAECFAFFFFVELNVENRRLETNRTEQTSVCAKIGRSCTAVC